MTVLNPTPIPIASSTFDDRDGIMLYVPDGSEYAYETADYWSDFILNVLPYGFYVDGIYYKKISENSLAVTYRDEAYNSYSGDVTINPLVSIGDKTYTVDEITDNAFRNCPELTSVNVSPIIKKIGDFAFYNCPKLALLYFYTFTVSREKSGVECPQIKEIGSNAFANCSSLKSLALPNHVESIGDNAFYNTPLDNLYYLSETSIKNNINLSSTTNVFTPHPSVSIDGVNNYKPIIDFDTHSFTYVGDTVEVGFSFNTPFASNIYEVILCEEKPFYYQGPYVYEEIQVDDEILFQIDKGGPYSKIKVAKECGSNVKSFNFFVAADHLDLIFRVPYEYIRG